MKVLNLGVDVGFLRVAKGGGDLVAECLAVPFAQPAGGLLDGRLGHLQLGGNLRTRGFGSKNGVKPSDQAHELPIAGMVGLVYILDRYFKEQTS